MQTEAVNSNAPTQKILESFRFIVEIQWDAHQKPFSRQPWQTHWDEGHVSPSPGDSLTRNRALRRK